MFLMFSSVAFNCIAGAAVFNSIKDFFVSSFDLPAVSVSSDNASNYGFIEYCTPCLDTRVSSAKLKSRQARESHFL